MELSSVLTIEGVAASAALVTGLIQLIKTALPKVDAGYEGIAALVLSALLVIVAFIDQNTFTLQAGFVAFVAWLSIAKLATGIYDEVSGNDRLLDTTGGE